MDEITELLKQAVSLELNGVQLYNFMAANLSGLFRPVLQELFSESATESLAHSDAARKWLKRAIGLSSDVMVLADLDPGDLPLPSANPERDFLQAAIRQETTAVRLYSDLYTLLNESQEDIALLNWAQNQVQVETEDLIEYEMLLGQI